MQSLRPGVSRRSANSLLEVEVEEGRPGRDEGLEDAALVDELYLVLPVERLLEVALAPAARLLLVATADPIVVVVVDGDAALGRGAAGEDRLDRLGRVRRDADELALVLPPSDAEAAGDERALDPGRGDGPE